MLETTKAGLMSSAGEPVRQRIGFKTMIAICVGCVVVQGTLAPALMGFGLGGLGVLVGMFYAGNKLMKPSRPLAFSVRTPTSINA